MAGIFSEFVFLLPFIGRTGFIFEVKGNRHHIEFSFAVPGPGYSPVFTVNPLFCKRAN
jgi:hypothetical protein